MSPGGWSPLRLLRSRGGPDTKTRGDEAELDRLGFAPDRPEWFARTAARSAERGEWALAAEAVRRGRLALASAVDPAAADHAELALVALRIALGVGGMGAVAAELLRLRAIQGAGAGEWTERATACIEQSAPDGPTSEALRALLVAGQRLPSADPVPSARPTAPLRVPRLLAGEPEEEEPTESVPASAAAPTAPETPADPALKEVVSEQPRRPEPEPRPETAKPEVPFWAPIPDFDPFRAAREDRGSGGPAAAFDVAPLPALEDPDPYGLESRAEVPPSMVDHRRVVGGDETDADALLRRWVQNEMEALSPEDTESRFDVGMMLLETGRYEEARLVFEECMQSPIHQIAAAEGMLQALHGSGQHPAALQTAHLILRVFRSRPESLAGIRYWQGRAAEGAGDRAHAIALYRAAEEERPGAFPDVAARLAQLASQATG